MAGFLILLAIGFAAGWMVGTLMEGRGRLGLKWCVLAGIAGSFLGGLVFAQIGERIVGPGPVFIASLLAAMVVAIALPLLIALIRK